MKWILKDWITALALSLLSVLIIVAIGLLVIQLFGILFIVTSEQQVSFQWGLSVGVVFTSLILYILRKILAYIASD